MDYKYERKNGNAIAIEYDGDGKQDISYIKTLQANNNYSTTSKNLD